MLKACILSLACMGLILAGGSVSAQDHTQQVGSPLNLAAIDLEPAYSNDFSANDRIDHETTFVTDGKRTRLPDPGAQWIAEGWGGASICAGKLWVAPVVFKACGERAGTPEQGPSHMVVWNKNRFPADMMFEFSVNHHGSDNGLTLVIFAAKGQQGQDIFDLDLPPRNGVYRNYNKGQLKNYTVSYWSRNKKPSLVAKGEAYSNRIRKNPGANILTTNASLTDKCSDCDYRVRILKLGGSITAEINGVVVNHVTDPDPHGSGYIGLRSMEGVDRISYDDFKVWSARLSDLSGTAEDRQVYLLIGQSNMAGRAPIEEVDKAPIEGCELFNASGEWEPATNPLNRYSTVGKKPSIQKLGPGYGFAKRWRELNPDIPLGLVVNARGGTKIAEWGKGTDYYNEAVARFKAALADGSRLGGVLWHQGEGDSRRTETYLDSLSALIAYLHSDLNAPDLPFIAGLLEMDERDFGKSPRLINKVILTLPTVVPNTAVASTEGLLTLDGTHFDSAGQRELGKRYAEALFGFNNYRVRVK